MAWNRSAAGWAAVVLLGLAACGGGDGPFADRPEGGDHTLAPTATPSSSPSRTATPTATVIPSSTATSIPPVASATPTHSATPTASPSPSPTPSATPEPTVVATATPTASPTETPSPSPIPDVDLIATALRTGDARPLPDSAAATLLDTAAQSLRSVSQGQQALVRSLVDAQTFAPVDFSNNSQNIAPDLSTAAVPFMVSDKGVILASISTVHSGRGVGYGKDLLGPLSSANGGNQSQLPLMQRTWSWLVTGDAKKPLPATVRIATQNYDFPTVANLAARMGVTAQKVVCNLSDLNNTCWEDADLLIFGPNINGNADWETLGTRYMAGGKGVIYTHTTWSDSPGGRKLLASMGMRLGDYGGNFWEPGSGYQITAAQSLQQQLAATDRLSGHIAAVEQLQ